MSFRTLALLALVLAGAVDWYLHYDQLPDWLATNFGGNGLPNSWMEKPKAAAVLLGGFVGLALLLAALPWLLAKAPRAVFNIPHRDYWLGPERYDQTMATLTAYLGTVNVMTVGLFLVVNRMVIRANLEDEPRLSALFLPMMIGYLGLLSFLTIRLFMRFRRP